MFTPRCTHPRDTRLSPRLSALAGGTAMHGGSHSPLSCSQRGTMCVKITIGFKWWFPTLLTPVTPLVYLSIKAEKHICFHVKVTCDVVGLKRFPEETDTLDSFVISLSALNSECSESTLNIYVQVEIGWLIPRSLDRTTYFRSLWMPHCVPLETKLTTLPRHRMPRRPQRLAGQEGSTVRSAGWGRASPAQGRGPRTQDCGGTCSAVLLAGAHTHSQHPSNSIRIATMKTKGQMGKCTYFEVPTMFPFCLAEWMPHHNLNTSNNACWNLLHKSIKMLFIPIKTWIKAYSK